MPKLITLSLSGVTGAAARRVRLRLITSNPNLEADSRRNSEVFENIKKDLFDDADAETYDLDAFDGYDELPAEAQTKVAKGFELMHGSARFISVLVPC